MMVYFLFSFLLNFHPKTNKQTNIKKKEKQFIRVYKSSGLVYKRLFFIFTVSFYLNRIRKKKHVY